MWRPPFRFLSSWLDDAVLNGGVVLEQRRAFADTKDARPPAFEELISEITEKNPEIHWNRSRRRFFWERVPVSLRSFPYESFIDFHKCPKGPADTLVVYHHGLGEIPHDTLPHVLFRHPKLRARCDWIAIKGIHHKSLAEVSGRLLRDRNTFIRSLAASAGLCKQIAQDIGSRYQHVVMVGTSMGGIISLVETCHEPQFQLYVPFIAGPNLADVMLKSSFRCLIHSGFRRREHQSPWLHELDMTWRLEGQSGPPIRPLLARSDRLFRYEEQVKAYERIQRAEIATFEGGHITGAVNLPVFAKHVVSMITKNCWEAAPKSTKQLSEAKVA